WPVWSYQLNRAHAHLKQQMAAGQSIEDNAEAVLKLLDMSVAVPLANQEQVMQTLAVGGLTYAHFAAHTTNLVQQQFYRVFLQAAGRKKLHPVTTIPEALAVIEAHQLASYDVRSLIAILLQKQAYSETSIDHLRCTAQFLCKLPRALEESASTGHWPDHPMVVQVMQRLVYDSLDYPDVARYWMTYRALDATVEEFDAFVSVKSSRSRPPYEAIQDRTRQLGQVQDSIREIELENFGLPHREQEWHRAILDVDLTIGHFLAMDYQDRHINIAREIDQLKTLGMSQPAYFLAIDKSGNGLLEHNNPWCTLTFLLLRMLESIQTFDRAYITWAEDQLSEVLQGVFSLEDLPELDKQLVNLTIAGDSFGPMVDGTLRMLLEIGQEVQTALRLPEDSKQRNQALIEALEKSDDLHRWLRTRYSRSLPRDWAGCVRQISGIIQERLNKQRGVDAARYHNPYIVGNPVPKTKTMLFKGRQDLAQKIIDILCSDSHPTLVLHGARRMGKTSFLLHLHNLMRGWSDSPLTVVVGGQETGLVAGDASFFYFLAREIYKCVSPLTNQRMARPDQRLFDRYPYASFTPWLEDEVLPVLGEQRLLITIDEFEKVGNAIKEGLLSVRILDFLRHTIQHNENLLFLFCGVETLDALGPNAASYFIGVQAIEIGYLSNTAARELIRDPDFDVGTMPVYSRVVVNEILRLTHNQPYLIQAICSKIVDAANDRNLKHINKSSIVERVLPDVFAVNSLYFENIWFDAGASGREILAKLAAGPAQLTGDEWASAAVQGLSNRHVICPVAGGEDGLYEIEIPLVQQWVAARL
ncbi:hypothetical protein ACFLYO_11470, partial [Chloroflexota bacterium]